MSVDKKGIKLREGIQLHMGKIATVLYRVNGTPVRAAMTMTPPRNL
jgi:hypothetical protein